MKWLRRATGAVLSAGLPESSARGASTGRLPGAGRRRRLGWRDLLVFPFGHLARTRRKECSLVLFSPLRRTRFPALAGVGAADTYAIIDGVNGSSESCAL